MVDCEFGKIGKSAVESKRVFISVYLLFKSAVKIDRTFSFFFAG